MENENEKEYIATLSNVELMTLNIAKKHFGSSYILSCTCGYIHWLNNKKNKKRLAVDDLYNDVRKK